MRRVLTTHNEESKTEVIAASDVVQVPSVVDEQPSAKRTNANNSSKTQLLNLAKRFSIDGAIVPMDKQPPIEDRARKRSRIDHLRKQQNIEQIIEKALGYCAEDTIAERTDYDWFTSYIEQAQTISNSTMQELWARILAKEVDSPGAFSLKGLKTFKSLSIHDAKLIGKVASLTVRDSHRKNIRIISGSVQLPGLFNFFSKDRTLRVNLSQLGFNYSDLLNLAENGLMYVQEAESTILTKNEVLNFNYNGQPLSFTTKKSNCVLSFYKFTPVGAEIINLISDKPDTRVLTALQESLASQFRIE